MDNREFAAKAFFDTHQMIARLDTREGKILFIQRDDDSFPLNEYLDLKETVQKYLKKKNVHPEDKPKLEEIVDMDRMRGKCSRGENGSLCNYRRLTEKGIVWSNLVISIPSDYSQEQPEILLFRRDMAPSEAGSADGVRALGERVHKILKYDALEGRFTVVRLRRAEEGLRTRYENTCFMPYEPMIEEEFIHPDDLEDFRNAIAYHELGAHFALGNKEKTVYYRRRFGGRYQWVKMMHSPASEYTPEHPVLLIYIIDVHRALAGFFSRQGNAAFLKRYKKTNEGITSFYQNVLNALSFFTQKYLDFYIVDLERDLYMKYKLDREVIDGTVPYVGSYSKMMEYYFQEKLSLPQNSEIYAYATAAKLRKALTDKMSVDYSYTNEKGVRVKTICTKSEAVNGIPMKVVCRTRVVTDSRQLKVKTFGNFEVYDGHGKIIEFRKKKSKQLLAYLIDSYGDSVSTADVVRDVLEKPENDLNAKKYVSTLAKMAMETLEQAGYPDVIRREWNSLRVNLSALDCDYYHLLEGDTSYWELYHNEYMKDYPWAKRTNRDLLQIGNR